MLSSLVQDTGLPLLEQVATFTERRQQVLAKNIAHIETPDYRRRDLPVAEFQQALREAVEQQTSVSVPGHPHRSGGSPSKSFSAHLFQETIAEPTNVTFQDAGQRSIEREFMELKKNLLLQQFAVQMLIHQYGSLQTAISERV